MNSPLRVATALACFAFAHVSLADTIHAIQGGGFYHHQSGWVFPETIGDFSLVGVPGTLTERWTSRLTTRACQRE